MENQILVLGATGKTGSRVAERLQKMGIRVRSGSRTANPPFDWEKPNGWSKALEGIQHVYVTFQPDFMVPGALEKIQLFVDTAKRSGAQKLVLLSGRGAPAAEKAERIVMDSGLLWTVVRASWFMQNYSEFFFLDAILEGRLVVPKTKALEPFVDIDDIAEIAVAALTDDKHNGRLYEVTGPELLSFGDATRKISKSIGRAIAFEEVDIEAYKNMLRGYQIPEDVIGIMEILFTEEMDGRNESLADGIKKALGREPGSFDEYVAKAKMTGVWDNKNTSV